MSAEPTRETQPLWEQDRPDTDFLKDIWKGIEGKEILVIGNGSLGSAFRFALGSMGIETVGLDPDVWEERNFANSFATEAGEQKAEYKATVEDIISGEYLERDAFLMVVTATDNIPSRRAAFQYFTPEAGFLDLRAGREVGTFVSSLWPPFMRDNLPDEADFGEDELACSERGSMAHTMTIAGIGASRAINMLDLHFGRRVIPSSMEQVGFRGSQLSPMSFSGFPVCTPRSWARWVFACGFLQDFVEAEVAGVDPEDWLEWHDLLTDWAVRECVGEDMEPVVVGGRTFLASFTPSTGVRFACGDSEWTFRSGLGFYAGDMGAALQVLNSFVREEAPVALALWCFGVFRSRDPEADSDLRSAFFPLASDAIRLRAPDSSDVGVLLPYQASARAYEQAPSRGPLPWEPFMSGLLSSDTNETPPRPEPEDVSFEDMLRVVRTDYRADAEVLTTQDSES